MLFRSAGSGKVEEIRAAADALDAATVIFNHELSPAQQRNLEKALERTVLDRTELILNIFAQRARTNEGKLQVELAQLGHLSTRLVRGWTHLERQRGGLGKTGGPGEKQIELDRRLIGERVKLLKRKLVELRDRRGVQRRARARRDVLAVSIVGYTNAGKSTLFNRLTGAGVVARDQLFATLDPTMREVKLASGRKIIVSDTVGFVSDLHHATALEHDVAMRSAVRIGRGADVHVIGRRAAIVVAHLARLDGVGRRQPFAIEQSDGGFGAETSHAAAAGVAERAQRATVEEIPRPAGQSLFDGGGRLGRHHV